MTNQKSRIADDGRDCRKCRDFLPWGAFYKSAAGARGYDTVCAECRRAINAEKKKGKADFMEGFCPRRQDFTNGGLGVCKHG